MPANILPPENRHESFTHLMCLFTRLDEARVFLENARYDGPWSAESKNIATQADSFLTRSAREIESLLERAGTTKKGTPL